MGSEIQLRAATVDDIRTVFAWRNDPYIRARSSHPDYVVTWDEHRRWFNETLQDDKRLIFIVTLQEQPIGQVRFDRIDAARSIISVYVLSQFTGAGYGVDAIRRGCKAAVEAWGEQTIIACVRAENRAGSSGFRKAGFVQSEPSELCPKEHDEFHLVARRSSCGEKG